MIFSNLIWKNLKQLKLMLPMFTTKKSIIISQFVKTKAVKTKTVLINMSWVLSPYYGYLDINQIYNLHTIWTILKYLIETFRLYKNESNDDHIHKHIARSCRIAADPDLERSQWLTNVLEKSKNRWHSSFDNVGCLKTAISVSYIHTFLTSNLRIWNFNFSDYEWRQAIQIHP